MPREPDEARHDQPPTDDAEDNFETAVERSYGRKIVAPLRDTDEQDESK